MIRKILKALIYPDLIWPYFVKMFRHRVSRVVKDGKGYYEYMGELYPECLKKGEASSWISDKALKYCSGRGIDVGAGKWPLPGAIPVQDQPHQNAYRLDNFTDGSLDFVFSSHCLEHLENWPEALALWSRKLRPGGVMFLYLPHESMLLWRPGAPWVKQAHRWIPTAEAVSSLLESNSLEITERGPEKDDFWSFYIVANKRGG